MTLTMTKLSRAFNADAILAAVARANDSAPIAAGYPTEGHRGWTSTVLYSAHHGLSRWAAAEPALTQLVKELGLSLKYARFLTIEAGGIIKEHRDVFLGGRIARLHIPLRTHDDVEMHIDGERCHWHAGEFWYGDFSRPHRAVNNSHVSRVHLVIDAEIDDALLNLVADVQARKHLAERAAAVAVAGEGANLSRFVTQFSLPAGFSLPHAEYPPLPEKAAGSVAVVAGELWICVNEQPLLRAVPVSDDTADILGLPIQARLHYEYAGGRVAGVNLAVEGSSTAPMHFPAC